MFLRNRPVGWVLSALLGFALGTASTMVRPARVIPQAEAEMAAGAPVVAVHEPSAVIGASRFIAERYRVPAGRARQIAKVAFRVSRERRVNPYLVLAVIAVESSFRPHVVNPHGAAYGLMQIAVHVHARRVEAVGGRERLFLIRPNIRIGVALLVQYGARMRSGIRHALWRYSGGEYGYARKVLRLSEVLQRKAAEL